MKVGSQGFLLSSAAPRLSKGASNLNPEGLGLAPFLLSQVAGPSVRVDGT